MKVIKILGTGLAVLLVVLLGLYLSGYGGKLAMSVFMAINSPDGDFDPAVAVAPPDYADPANWAALPNTDDPADLVPEGIAPTVGVQPVDVFFIHPTGFLKSVNWTSPMDPHSGTEENTRWMMANQASAYNGCCNVHAPRYREANIFAYFGEEEERDAILAFAYEDVKRAFNHFLQYYNQGRPFVIAGHSQGTHHAMRLLKEEIDSSDLHQRMVAAYLIGAVVIPVSSSWFASMSNVVACERADDLHCVVHWDTMPEGAEPIERPEQSLCTNPLSWRVDEDLAPAELNEGAVVPAGTYNSSLGRGEDEPTMQVFDALDAPVNGHTRAQCREGSLFAEDQTGTGFSVMGSDELGTYHGLDYALFYMNIRNNAQLRARRYLVVGSGRE